MGNVFFWIVVAIAIFLLVREFMCWYWKIDTMIIELDKINYNINTMVKEMEKTNRLLTNISYSQSNDNPNIENNNKITNAQNIDIVVDKPKWSKDIPEL